MPDEIVVQVCDAYAKFRSDEIDRDMDDIMTKWRTRWEAENPAPKQRHLSEYHDRYRTEFEQHRLSVLPEVVAKRPERLGQYDAPQLIRATKMLICRPHSKHFGGEGDKVLDAKVELFDEELSVLEIHKKYSLWDIKASMEKVFPKEQDALLASLAEQLEELTGIRQQLVYLRSDMSE
ncbi:hypothetical protein OIT41_20590 (plasmid) [Arthrobacter sp. YA7-1]|uniref:hypothetical protein n=1 Tax=Arthrobacter sp. YA7-1 TaxID=2987701 RepID=UPI0022274FA3|nr:hypothetical protein [Arthrobacter sp. YA7-1]UYY83744.1 hypothetical protein OIT41_20590 [Arthrobacter sp. YA7-1]